MAFQDQAKLDLLAALGSDMGEGREAITYTPDGGSAVSRQAIIARNAFGPQFDADGTGVLKVATVLISLDATFGVAAPAIKDAVTFDSLTWLVRDIDREVVDGSALLTVAFYDNIEHSQADHVIQR